MSWVGRDWASLECVLGAAGYRTHSWFQRVVDKGRYLWRTPCPPSIYLDCHLQSSFEYPQWCRLYNLSRQSVPMFRDFSTDLQKVSAECGGLWGSPCCFPMYVISGNVSVLFLIGVFRKIVIMIVWGTTAAHEGVYSLFFQACITPQILFPTPPWAWSWTWRMIVSKLGLNFCSYLHLGALVQLQPWVI